MSEFRNRLLFPFGVTLGAATVIVAVVFSLSRVLLALEQESSSATATIVAMAGASAVLLGAVWSVARRRAGSRPVVAVLLGAGIMLVAAGSVSHAVLGGGEEAGGLAQGGGATAERPPPVTITAFDLGFKEAEVTSVTGDVEIRYANEGELDHTLVFEGAPGSFKLEAPAGGTTSGSVMLAPGTYAYFCDLPGHRTAGMQGSLTVVPGEGGIAGGGGGKASATQVVAQDIAFEPTEITVPAGPIEVTLTNKGAILHTLVVDGLPGFRKLEAAEGATATGTLDARPGTYTYYCDQPGHRAAGMEGKLTVK